MPSPIFESAKVSTLIRVDIPLSISSPLPHLEPVTSPPCIPIYTHKHAFQATKHIYPLILIESQPSHSAIMSSAGNRGIISNNAGSSNWNFGKSGAAADASIAERRRVSLVSLIHLSLLRALSLFCFLNLARRCARDSKSGSAILSLSSLTIHYKKYITSLTCCSLFSLSYKSLLL